MPNGTGKIARILMVDDNPTDILIMRRALLKSGMPHKLLTAPDGQAAIEMLCAVREGPERRRPDLILLDLNMPKKNGFVVLKELKEDRCLRMIPVLIFTSSSYQEDVERCYALQANSFISKPASLPELTELVNAIGRYWFGAVRLPQ